MIENAHKNNVEFKVIYVDNRQNNHSNFDLKHKIYFHIM